MVKPGIDLPPADRHGRIAKYPFDVMAVGEIFFVPDTTTEKFTTYASKVGRKLKKKFRTQTAIMRQDLQTDEWEPCKPGAAGARRGVAVRRIA